MLYGINCLARFSETSCIADQSNERPHEHREFLSWAQRHYRIDVTASTVTQDGWAGICWRVPNWMQRVCAQRFERSSHQVNVQNLWYCSKGRTSRAGISPNWCALAHGSTHSCDFTNGYFQWQETDRILLFRIPAEGIPGGEISASRVPPYGTKDEGRGLWLRLKNT